MPGKHKLVPRNCKHCGKEFQAIFHLLKYGRERHCSVRCSLIGQPGRNTGNKHTEKTKKKISLKLKEIGMKPPSDIRAIGEKNWKWRGDKVGYGALHSWVRRYLGKAETCEFCGKEKTTPKSIHWANKSRKYLRELTDWISLCVSCHKQYDGAYRRSLV